MVNYFMGCLIQKPATAVAVVVILWMLLLLPPLFQRFVRLLPGSCDMMLTNLLHLLTLIKRRPVIYILFNFIIVYILLSSTFSLHLKFYKKPKSSLTHNPQLKPKSRPKHDVDDQTSSLPCSQTESEILPSWGGDDTWWCQIINGGEVEKTAASQTPEGGLGKVDDDEEDRKTAAFEEAPEGGLGKVRDDVEDRETSSLEETPQGVAVGNSEEDNKANIVIKGVDEEMEGQEDDTMDETWQAIMEAKNRGTGPQLKKSGTWTSGDRRVGKQEKSARYQVQLKKWKTFKGAPEERENGVVGGRGSGGGRGGGGGGRGWRKMEVVVTDHDELKKRSDAFIARFTHSIRLQRLESYQRFLEMINRGL